MRSQAYLLGHLAPAWRRLGRLVPLHAGLLVAALASQLLYEALWSYSHWHSHGFVALLFSLPLWLLFLGGLLMLRRLRGELLPLEEPVLHLLGRELDRVAAPGLWQWLGQIADRAGAPLPDHVVTGIEHCYFVTQAKVLLAPRGIPLEGRDPVHPADLCLGHERGRKRRDHRPRTRPLRRRRHRPRCLPVAPAAAGAPAHRTHRRPRGWACRPARQAGPVGRAVLPRSLRARLPALESPPGTGRRQGRGAGSRRAGLRHRAATHLRPCRTDRTPAGQPADAQPGACADRPSARELPGTGRTRQRSPPGTPLRQSPADLPADRGPSLALDDDLLRQARRIVSADDTQWLNRLLDAGHGKAGDPAGRCKRPAPPGQGRRSHAVAALRRQRPQPDKHRRRPWRGAAVRPARPAAARRRLDLARPPRSRP